MLFTIGCILVGIAVLLMIWPWLTEIIVYNQWERGLRKKLRPLIERANKGDKAAQMECDNNGLINKGMVLCEDGVNVKSTYSLPVKWL